MKRRVFNVILSLLVLLGLTACGQVQGADSASTSVQYGGGAVDLPVLPPEDNSRKGDGSDQNQAPSNADQSVDQDEGNQAEGNQSSGKSDEGNQRVDEDGWYTSKEEVALYIHLYERLPDNYVTKDEAEDAGWSGGNVERYTGEGTAIGGSYFGNREGLLPKARGRSYTECDIDTVGENSRGSKRIVFSNDGLVYYTDDHYESFELLYGEP